MRDIRFGIIGGGLMGREFASAIARWPHLLDHPARPRVTAVASRSQSTLDYFGAHYGRPMQLTLDYRQLLASPDIDAVYVAVPHDLHEKLYTEAIHAGKHLLGEKPFGIDAAANERILSAARSRPELIIRCSSEFPFFPGPQRIAKLLAEKAFGRILEVECGLLHSSDMDPRKPINWKRRIATNGEYGCMGDLGMHVLQLPLRAGFAIRNVRAILSKLVTQRPVSAGSTQMTPCETWDNATLLCEAADTAGQPFPLTAKMMRIAPGETNTWYISIKGTKLSARFSTRNPRALELMPYEAGNPQRWQEESLGYESIYRTITGGIFEFGFADCFQQMIAAYCDELCRGAGAVPFPCASLEETAATHAIFTAALRSQANGAVEVVA